MSKAISFASINLLNLARPGQATNPGARVLEADEFDAKVAWTARMIDATDADVYAFQEVWSESALRACLDASAKGSQYTVVARDAAPGRVEVGAAFRKTRLDLVSSEWIAEFPDAVKLVKRAPHAGQADLEMSVAIERFSRPVLQLRLRQRNDGQELVFMSIHLKSKLATELDRSEYDDPTVRPHRRALGEALSAIRRSAEVAALRVHLNVLLEGTRLPVVVAGDLNDGHLSTTAQILSAQPPVKLFSASTVGDQPTKGQDVGLYSAQMLQEFRTVRDVYYTYEFESLLESLDHIFVSEEFYEHSPNALWTFRELVVLNDHIHTRRERDRVVGDHGVVHVRFDAASRVEEP
jgi:endonuclease/exonuclease/phosphatase family metal-dependent hydrolase